MGEMWVVGWIAILVKRLFDHPFFLRPCGRAKSFAALVPACIRCAFWTTLVYVHCLLALSGIVWCGKHTSLGASMRHPCEFNVMSIYELLAECGLVFVRPQAFVDRSTHKYAPYFPGVCRWKYPADATCDDDYCNTRS